MQADGGTSSGPGRCWSSSAIASCRPPREQARATSCSSEAGLEIDQSTLEGDRANIENQRANLAKARAVADNDARQAVRMKTLFERGLVSATDFENARTNAESSQANVQSAEAQLRVADVQIVTAESQVRLSQAQLETNRAALTLARPISRTRSCFAPFSGFVAQRNLDPGAAVSAQSAGTNTSSVGILMLHDIETVKVQIEVPERDISRVRVGSPVRLTVDPYRGEAFTGSVARVVHDLDPRSRTMGVEVESPNPAGGSSPGCSRASRCSPRRGPAPSTVPPRRCGWATPALGDDRPGRRRRGGARRARCERRARRRGGQGPERQRPGHSPGQGSGEAQAEGPNRPPRRTSSRPCGSRSSPSETASPF